MVCKEAIIPDLKEGTWETLKKHPMTLMRMVIEGKADIIGKDNKGRYIYLLKEVNNDQSHKKTNRTSASGQVS